MRSRWPSWASRTECRAWGTEHLASRARRGEGGKGVRGGGPGGLLGRWLAHVVSGLGVECAAVIPAGRGLGLGEPGRTGAGGLHACCAGRRLPAGVGHDSPARTCQLRCPTPGRRSPAAGVPFKTASSTKRWRASARRAGRCKPRRRSPTTDRRPPACQEWRACLPCLLSPTPMTIGAQGQRCARARACARACGLMGQENGRLGQTGCQGNGPSRCMASRARSTMAGPAAIPAAHVVHVFTSHQETPPSPPLDRCWCCLQAEKERKHRKEKKDKHKKKKKKHHKSPRERSRTPASSGTEDERRSRPRDRSDPSPHDQRGRPGPGTGGRARNRSQSPAQPASSSPVQPRPRGGRGSRARRQSSRSPARRERRASPSAPSTSVRHRSRSPRRRSDRGKDPGSAGEGRDRRRRSGSPPAPPRR